MANHTSDLNTENLNACWFHSNYSAACWPRSIADSYRWNQMLSPPSIAEIYHGAVCEFWLPHPCDALASRTNVPARCSCKSCGIVLWTLRLFAQSDPATTNSSRSIFCTCIWLGHVFAKLLDGNATSNRVINSYSRVSHLRWRNARWVNFDLVCVLDRHCYKRSSIGERASLSIALLLTLTLIHARITPMYSETPTTWARVTGLHVYPWTMSKTKLGRRVPIDASGIASPLTGPSLMILHYSFEAFP